MSLDFVVHNKSMQITENAKTATVTLDVNGYLRTYDVHADITDAGDLEAGFVATAYNSRGAFTGYLAADVARPGHFVLWGSPWPRVYRTEADQTAAALGLDVAK